MSERILKYHQAINLALEEELARDDSVTLFGVDVGEAGHVFAAARGLQQRFGEGRVRDTPLSELGITGCAVGAAMSGLRPIVDLLYLDFVPLAIEQLVNQAAKISYLSNGAYCAPMTVLTLVGAGMGHGSHHSQNLEGWLASVPGIFVLMPATPRDVKACIKTAVRCDDPVVVIESLALWHSSGPVGGDDDLAILGRATVSRLGRDLTIVSVGRMLGPALAAADVLSTEGVDVEVVDLLSISPIDEETLCESVRKTGAAVVVHEALKPFGPGAEIAALLQEHVFDYLDAPIQRVTPPFTHIPANSALESIRIPSAEDILAAARGLRSGRAQETGIIQ